MDRPHSKPHFTWGIAWGWLSLRLFDHSLLPYLLSDLLPTTHNSCAYILWWLSCLWKSEKMVFLPFSWQIATISRPLWQTDKPDKKSLPDEQFLIRRSNVPDWACEPHKAKLLWMWNKIPVYSSKYIKQRTTSIWLRSRLNITSLAAGVENRGQQATNKGQQMMQSVSRRT